ncbi:hypothetical protein Tco_1463232 [Tanacetum coccineum]
MFAMICTRPDIAHVVGVVSWYMVKPGREHWKAVKRILRYIKGTLDVALCFGDSDLTVKGYVDYYYAGDLNESKSTTEYVFTLSGGIVSWVSKLQSIVAISTTEASKEASALYLVRNPTFHSNTKHIRIQYHFVHEKVEEGTVDMKKIHTDDNSWPLSELVMVCGHVKEVFTGIQYELSVVRFHQFDLFKMQRVDFSYMYLLDFLMLILTLLSSLEEPLGLDKLPPLSDIDLSRRFSSKRCSTSGDDSGLGYCWIDGTTCGSFNSYEYVIAATLNLLLCLYMFASSGN